MPKVLLVDDDVALAEVSRAHLEAAGFSVAVAHEAKTGLRLARKDSFDVAVLDVEMPGPSGHDLLAALRREPSTSELPVLFMSSKAGSEERIYGLQSGAGDFLPKPFDPVELTLRVRQLERLSEALKVALSGRIEEFPLHSLLERFIDESQSGNLLLTGPGWSGSVHLDFGAIRDVKLAHLKGMEALIEILDLDKGRFQFEARSKSLDTAERHLQEVDLVAALERAVWLELEARDVGVIEPTGTSSWILLREPPADLLSRWPTLCLAGIQDYAALGESFTLPELSSKAPWCHRHLRLAIALLEQHGCLVKAAS